MVIVGFALIALGAFVALAAAAERGSRIARTGALVEAAVILQLAASGLFVAALFLSLGCDDHCGARSGPRAAQWWNSEGTWEWWGQFAICTLGALCVTAAFIATKRARYRKATVLMTCATASFGAWAALLAPVASASGT